MSFFKKKCNILSLKKKKLNKVLSIYKPVNNRDLFFRFVLPGIEFETTTKLVNVFKVKSSDLGHYTIKHWTLKFISRLIFPKYSKKQFKTLLKISKLFITTIEKYLRKINDGLYQKSYLAKTNIAGLLLLWQKFTRTRKKKRSIRRSHRRLFFNSKFGRIWLHHIN